ncbi:GerW family sporulation protein [Terrimonas alba]|uniref:GerW family sporulation protein n=1 Tax=Terrimonas alba TaxID=3349636 RepID=UPI0035F2E96A
MPLNLEETISKLTDFLKSEANTETVIGKSFQLGEFTCLPIIKFGIGLGYGAGEGQGSQNEKGSGSGTGGGAGAGVGVEPIGFLATRGDQISFIPTSNKKGLSAVFEKLPDLFEKMGERKKEKESVKA